jgi:hypothetical protein
MLRHVWLREPFLFLDRIGMAIENDSTKKIRQKHFSFGLDQLRYDLSQSIVFKIEDLNHASRQNLLFLR